MGGRGGKREAGRRWKFLINKINEKNKDYKNLSPRDDTEITTLSTILPPFFSFGVLRQGFSG